MQGHSVRIMCVRFEARLLRAGFGEEGVRMRSYRIGLVVVGGLMAGAASAQLLTGNLLLRQTLATNAGFVNQIFSDFPTFSTGMGSEVTTTAAWNISNIQVFQIGSNTSGSTNTWFGNVNTATLTVSTQTA